MRKIEDEIIEKAYEALLNSYSLSTHRRKFAFIEKAFRFANHAHKNIKRHSGEPYILHPLSVALIVSEEIGLGSTSICAALLHDVVEDTEYAIEEIKDLFGKKIAQLVNGLTKISGGTFSETTSIQGENMRRLLLTMSSDIRVILIKIADRLHNMRTLGHLLPVKQYKIAGETLYLYAPLANRLGLFSIKSELEDLSFRYEHSIIYNQIEQQLITRTENWEKIYKQFTIPVKNALDSFGYRYKIQGRTKSIYSIWNKMKIKKINFTDIYDIFAVRIIFEPKPNQTEKKQCWDIYSIITDLYLLRPDRLRDWVSNPKANGYKSLHLTVMGPNGQWIEVQIRSFQMDEIAEKGLAAHWRYKEQGNNLIPIQNELDIWLEKIQSVLQTPTPNTMDFLDTIKLNLYNDEIFVFTPKGEIKILPQGATTLDFAYEIHSNIGNQCIGAKVNHRLTPISYKLASGDQVEILTSSSQHPQKEWLSFVTTSSAKTKIESILKKQRKIEIYEGESILNFYLKNAGIELTSQVLNKICFHYGYSKKESLFSELAKKQIKLPKNLHFILKSKTKHFFMNYVKQAFNTIIPSQNSQKILENKFSTKNLYKINNKKTYLLDESPFQKKIITLSCCNPIPGDEVFGFIRADGQLEVHKKLCNISSKIKTHFGNRLISCKLICRENSFFIISIELKGIDRIGLLNDITQVITKYLAFNIHQVSLSSNKGIFEGTIKVSIRSAEDIQILCSELEKVKGLKNIFCSN